MFGFPVRKLISLTTLIALRTLYQDIFYSGFRICSILKHVISIHILCAHKGRKNHLENLHKNLNKYMRSSYICDPPGQEEMYFIDL